jgi:hypothetical protein
MLIFRNEGLRPLEPFGKRGLRKVSFQALGDKRAYDPPVQVVARRSGACRRWHRPNGSQCLSLSHFGIDWFCECCNQQEVGMNIFDWVGDLVSRACHHDAWKQCSAWSADAWAPFRPDPAVPVVTRVPGEEWHLFYQRTYTNPVSGLLATGPAGISHWDRHASFCLVHNGFNQFSSPRCIAPGYDPMRGW